MSTSSSVDVIVVGAGAVGASCAYHLSKSGRSVLVAETFGGPAEGSTGRSFASIRSQWADSLNIEMSWRSVRAYRSFPADHGIAGATWGPADGVVDPHLATRAYLDLARAAGAQVSYRCRVTAIEPDTNRGGWEVSAGGGPAC